jgi:hypothetical protein
MMLEIFKYTERVVNMIRPRKLLFMAIGTYIFADVLDFDVIILQTVLLHGQK